MCLKPLVQYNLNSFSVRNDLILLWIEYDHWYFFLCLGPGCGLKIYGQFRTIAHAQAKLVKNIRSLGKGKPQKIGKTHRWPVRQLFLPFGLLGERYVVVSVLPWERHLVGPNILKGISNRVRHVSPVECRLDPHWSTSRSHYKIWYHFLGMKPPRRGDTDPRPGRKFHVGSWPFRALTRLGSGLEVESS